MLKPIKIQIHHYRYIIPNHFKIRMLFYCQLYIRNFVLTWASNNLYWEWYNQIFSSRLIDTSHHMKPHYSCISEKSETPNLHKCWFWVLWMSMFLYVDWDWRRVKESAQKVLEATFERGQNCHSKPETIPRNSIQIIFAMLTFSHD